MSDNNANSKRLPRWWSGGVCSALAVTTTHPLDLIKVQLQTQSGADRKSVGHIMGNIYRQGGFLGFYNGISASWFRQLTYTTSRFALYEWGKQFVDSSQISSKWDWPCLLASWVDAWAFPAMWSPCECRTMPKCRLNRVESEQRIDLK